MSKTGNMEEHIEKIINAGGKFKDSGKYLAKLKAKKHPYKFLKERYFKTHPKISDEEKKE